MWKPLIRCSIVGGIVVFLWSMVSWVVLPMHRTNIHQFVEPKEVESCITKYAPNDGVYVLPCADCKKEDAAQSPFIFVNIRRGMDLSCMSCQMVTSIITQIIAAFLITYLLIRAKVSKYWNRVWFVVAISGIAALLGILPTLTWWHFPGTWVFLEFFDLIVAWFIGGLVIAKLVKN